MAAASSASATSGSDPVAPRARCRACSSGSDTTPASRRCRSARSASSSAAYTSDASSGCVKRIGSSPGASTAASRASVEPGPARSGPSAASSSAAVGCESAATWAVTSRASAGNESSRARSRPPSESGSDTRCVAWSTPPLLERSTDLDRVERVPSRHPMHPFQHRRAELQVERVVEEPIDLGGAERLHGQSGDSVRGQVRDDCRRLRRRVGPLGDDDDHGFALETSEREAHDAGRRLVEPLRVVDPDCQRPARRRGAHELEHGERERERLDRLTFDVRPHERDVQGHLLRRRQLRPGIDQVAEQVVQPGERQSRLCLRGPGDDDAIPALCRGVERGLPDRGLPDPGLALQEQCTRPRAGTLKERFDQRQLALAADHLRPSARSADHNPAPWSAT